MDLKGKVSWAYTTHNIFSCMQVAIITGAASGIGLETAELFLRLNPSVLGVDKAPCPQVRPESKYFKFFQADLTKSDSAEEIVKVCKAEFGGRIDTLLNIAGVMGTNNSVDTWKLKCGIVF